MPPAFGVSGGRGRIATPPDSAADGVRHLGALVALTGTGTVIQAAGPAGGAHGVYTCSAEAGVSSRKPPDWCCHSFA